MSISGGFSLNVTSNVNKIQSALDGLGKNQIPFATHRALNDAAFDVRKEIVESVYPKSFVVKNRSFAKAMFRVKKSPNKRVLEARVFDRFGKDYMQNQAVGGIKRKQGRYIAIPGRDRPVVRSRTSYDKNQPRTVLENPKSFQQTVKGEQMILQRRTKKPYPLKRLYLLNETDVKIPKRFPFYEKGLEMAKKSFNKNFAKRFLQAKRTARR